MALLEILYRDKDLVAINKPHGLLVHRSPLARDVEIFALQLLRDQIGQRVWPVHRLDRKTGGVLLFALSETVLRSVQLQFAENKVEKTYLAIVRGYTDAWGEIDYPLQKENGQWQGAVTRFKTLAHAELEIPHHHHPTSRYSLVEIKPQTGRMHQIRRHFSHIFHPIIGDRPHGCNKQNRLFKEEWDMTTMLLHACSLNLTHPVSGDKMEITASWQEEFERMMGLMGWGEVVDVGKVG